MYRMENYFDDPPWKILIKFQKLAGFWPYQNHILNFVLRILWTSFFLVVFTGLVIRLIEEWNHNLHIVIENMVILILISGVLAAMLTVFTQGYQLQKVFEKVAMPHQSIIDGSEVEVLLIYSKKGLSFSTKIVALVSFSAGFFVALPFLKMFSLYFFGYGVIEKKLPVYVNFLIDEEEYFFYILAYVFVAVMVGFVVYSAIGMNVILSVRYTCALFEIIKLRLKRASELFEQSFEQNRTLSGEQGEYNAYQIISSAVQLHKEAFNLTKTIDSTYKAMFFYVLLLNATAIVPVPSIVMLNIDDAFQTLRYTFGLILFSVNFYGIFYQGQIIIDHSTSVFDSCCDFCWHKASKRSQIAILIMMSNSLMPRQLTGASMFELSMQTYSVMLKTALSYVSLVSALFM